MALKVEKRSAVSDNPKIMLLYGAPKVGKTTMLSQLDDCLILDTEQGSRMVSGHILELNSKDDLMAFYKEAEEGHSFKYVALDTIDKLIEWTEMSVIREFQVDAIADLAYGKGFGLVRQKVINNVRKLASLFDNVIIIGHRKTAAAIENSNAVEPESLDISGKLKNMLMAMSDAIGYVYRDDEEKLVVSFQANKALEAGSRSPHLRGKVIDFKWNEIYK
tara:strand:- start:403 stop:1059 length:657 start_codon:yes stop_codon:yes gene_type:complete